MSQLWEYVSQISLSRLKVRLCGETAQVSRAYVFHDVSITIWSSDQTASFAIDILGTNIALLRSGSKYSLSEAVCDVSEYQTHSIESSFLSQTPLA